MVCHVQLLCFLCCKPGQAIAGTGKCAHDLRHHDLNVMCCYCAIWRHGTRSTLAQVMACCLTASSHYLNQCWLIIGEVPWHSSQGIILRWCEDTNQWNEIAVLKRHLGLPGVNELMIILKIQTHTHIPTYSFPVPLYWCYKCEWKVKCADNN